MFRICRDQRGFGGYEIVRFRRFVGRITFAATASSLIKLFESTRPTITLSIVLKDIICATLAPGNLLGSKTVLQTNVGCPQPLLQCQGSRRLQGNYGQHLGSFLFISDFIRQCVMLGYDTNRKELFAPKRQLQELASHQSDGRPHAPW